MTQKKSSFILIAIIFLVLMPAIHAESLFSGWAFEDQPISAGGKTFELKAATDYKYIFLQNSKSSIGVAIGECIEEDMMSICFQNTSYDRDLRKTKMKLEINQITPTISITRTAGKSTLYLGETTNITVKIKNTGGYVAENAHYEDSLSGFKITDVTGCSKLADGTTISWYGRLKVNETRTCTYHIYPTEILEKTIKAKFEYVDSEKRTVYSSGISLKTLPVLDLAIYANNEIGLGNKTQLTINLSSRSNTTFQAAIKLILPKGLSFNYSSYFKQDTTSEQANPFQNNAANTGYIWNGTISKSNITSLKLYVQAVRTGYNEILINTQYEFLNKNYSLENKKTMNVQTKELILTTSIPIDAKFDEETQTWIKISAQNPNSAIKISNLRIIVDSPLFDSAPYLIGELNESTNQIVLILKKIMPKTNTTKTYNFNINSTYQTPFGETFSKTLTGKITVLPIADLVITTDISNANPRSEETITITTKIKNPRNKQANNVNVYDDSTPTSGSNSGTMSLNTTETKTAYSYNMKMPYVHEEQEINITTHAAYSEDGKQFNYNLTKSIKISKKDLKITATRTVPQVLRGSIFSNTYEISNPLSEEVKNIKLALKKQQGFDLINSKSEYEIPMLAPGEKIKFSLDLKSKENKTISYQGESLSFKDNRGTQYWQNLSDESITPLYSSSNSPIIYLEKNASNSDVIVGIPTEIFIIIKNTGVSSDVILSDDAKEWTLSMPANTIKTVSYNKTFNSNGTYELSQLKAQYEFNGKTINSYSQKKSIKVNNFNNPIIKPANSQFGLIEKTKEIKTETSINPIITQSNQTIPVTASPIEESNASQDSAQNNGNPTLTEKFMAFIKYIFGI